MAKNKIDSEKARSRRNGSPQQHETDPRLSAGWRDLPPAKKKRIWNALTEDQRTRFMEESRARLTEASRKHWARFDGLSKLDAETTVKWAFRTIAERLSQIATLKGERHTLSGPAPDLTDAEIWNHVEHCYQTWHYLNHRGDTWPLVSGGGTVVDGAFRYLPDCEHAENAYVFVGRLIAGMLAVVATGRVERFGDVDTGLSAATLLFTTKMTGELRHLPDGRIDVAERIPFLREWVRRFMPAVDWAALRHGRLAFVSATGPTSPSIEVTVEKTPAPRRKLNYPTAAENTVPVALALLARADTVSADDVHRELHRNRVVASIGTVQNLLSQAHGAGRLGKRGKDQYTLPG